MKGRVFAYVCGNPIAHLLDIIEVVVFGGDDEIGDFEMDIFFFIVFNVSRTGPSVPEVMVV